MWCRFWNKILSLSTTQALWKLLGSKMLLRSRVAPNSTFLTDSTCIPQAALLRIQPSSATSERAPAQITSTSCLRQDFWLRTSPARSRLSKNSGTRSGRLLAASSVRTVAGSRLHQRVLTSRRTGLRRRRLRLVSSSRRLEWRLESLTMTWRKRQIGRLSYFILTSKIYSSTTRISPRRSN